MAKAAAKKSPSKKPPPAQPAKPATPASSDTEAEGSAAALAEFLPEAKKFPSRDIRPLRADPALAYYNVDVGLRAVEPHEAELAALPAPFDLATMKSLRRLALGVIYAAAQVDRSSAGTTRKLMKRASELRDVLLSAAVALMKAGLLPAQQVKKIIAGRGNRDMVQDCIDLAELFRQHQKSLLGKTAVTKEQIDEAAAVGNQLIVILKPARAKAKASEAVQKAVETRDRMWTLLYARHGGHLRRAGMWLWGDEVDEHVPPLLSSVGRKAKKPDSGGVSAGEPGEPDGEG
jgi:hypothetical protein